MKRSYKHKMKTILAQVLVFAMVMMAVAVAPAASVKAAAKPTITKATRNIIEGDLYDLGVKNLAKGSRLTWTTSNKKVATVDQDGVVIAKGKGKATITCTVTDAKNKVYKLTCKITVIRPAKRVYITNEATVLNLGQKYDLNTRLVPSSSNDTITWSSSDKKIANPDKDGKFTALAKGIVTITGKTLSGKKVSLTLEVIDAEGLVVNQEGLNKLLGTGVGLITIKTDAAENFVIPNGDYSNQKLIVDAPNSDVHNNGIFASIEIKNIKANTWYEGAQGNKIEVTATKVRIIVNAGASAGIEIKRVGSTIVLVNDGVVTELSVEAAANIEILGASKEPVPVVTKVEGINITSNVPLALDCKEKVTLTLNKGAEGTTVSVESQDKVPTISGTVAVTISVGPKDGSKPAEVIIKQPAAGPAQGGSGGPSGPSGPTGPTTATINKGTGNSFVLPVEYTALTAVQVRYGAASFDISSSMLATLKGFLSNDNATITAWRNITDATNSDFIGYNAHVVAVSGSGDLTKDVTLTLPILGSKTYRVTVNPSSSSVTITTPDHNTYTITKGADNRTLTITNAPSSLSFVITY